MREKVFRIKIFFEVIRCAPHLLLFFTHRNKHLIYADVERWKTIYKLSYGKTVAFLYLMSFFPEYRNVFYMRVGIWKYIINFLCPRMSTLYIYTTDVGKGMFIQHGFATVIAAQSIGENCWINQQVTIGYSDENNSPFLKDNVTINAGAQVIGGITIGNNSVVGANAVVVKDVPPNCTVAGVPAQIIKRNGIKVKENL